MTVVLLDPQRPTLVPLEAMEHLGEPVQFTEEVPVAVRWRLADGGAGAPVLISTDPEHPSVRERIEAGEQVVSAPAPPGGAVLEAIELMDKLWGFGGWEVTQSHESLRPYLLEETYELLDAIAVGDPESIREELGDLLLQVLFHARIAQESAHPFTVDDVAATLVAKLAHRSPHLADDVSGPIDIRAQELAWERRKASEKSRRSCLDGIAMDQPALALTEKVLARSSKAGLPDDLVPTALLAVTLGGAESAELRLRKAVLSFVDRVRAAEDEAERTSGDRTPLSDEQWRTYWSTT